MFGPFQNHNNYNNSRMKSEWSPKFHLLIPFDKNLSSNSDHLLALDETMRLEHHYVPVKMSLCAVGVVCNILAILGLKVHGKKFRTSDKLLLTLSIWDLLFLFTRMCQYTLFELYSYGEAGSRYCAVVFFLYIFVMSLSRLTFMISLACTILVVLERCVCCFMPVKMMGFYNKKRIALVILSTVLVPMLVYTPEVAIYLCIYDVYPHSVMNTNLHTRWVLCSDMDQFDTLVTVTVISRIGYKFLGWLALLVLDSILIHRLCVGARAARRLFSHQKQGSAKSVHHLGYRYRERSLTAAVVSMVVVSLVAYPVTGLAWAMSYLQLGWRGLVDPRLKTMLEETGRLFQIINSSTNVLFLIIFGSRFRKNLRSKLCCVKYTADQWRS